MLLAVGDDEMHIGAGAMPHAALLHQPAEAEGDAWLDLFGRDVAGAAEIHGVLSQPINDRPGQHAARRDQGGGESKAAAFLGRSFSDARRWCRISSAMPVS